MEKKINVAELLKDCPKGMELDCTMYDNCTLRSVLEGLAYPIRIDTPDGLVLLNEYGCYSRNEHAKCIIFPKGKTTWEGFELPGMFEDGDIVATNSGQWIGITTGGVKLKCIPTYCVVKYNGKFEAYLEEKRTWGFDRLATEEEKEKLFKAINDNGYQWNAETKTLVKLVEPKFKVGDIVQYITDSTDRRKIEEIDTLCNMYHTDSSPIIFEIEDEWKSVLNSENVEQNLPDKVEPKFKVGDKVRHKNNHNVVFTITSIEEDSYGCGVATAFWFDDQDDYELVPDKFDITTLKPFDRVLARCSYLEKWRIQFFEKYDKTCKYPFICMGYNKHGQCIPYEGNEHLLDTADNCDEFYKNWK